MRRRSSIPERPARSSHGTEPNARAALPTGTRATWTRSRLVRSCRHERERREWKGAVVNTSLITSIQPQFQMIDGLKIRYADSGGAHESTLLLTSPWPESLYAFAPM